MYANIIDTLFNQKPPVHREAGFLNVDRQTDKETDILTNIVTYRLIRPRGRFSEHQLAQPITTHRNQVNILPVRCTELLF